jgi:iron complex transport system substrate-binding protein
MSKRFGFTVLAGLAVIASMTVPAAGQAATACVQNFEAGTDYFPDKASIAYADGFTIDYFGSYKVLTVSGGTGDVSDVYTYVLVQCGTPAPVGYEDAVTVEVPVDAVVSMSTTYLAGLDALGLGDSIAAVDEFDYVFSAAVRARIDAGEISEVGSGASLNVEGLVALEPDVIFSYGDSETFGVLQDLGLTPVANADWLETSPLGRAEWVKFLAAFYNAEAEANLFFEDIEAEYLALAGLTAGVEERPTVLLNAMYNDTWYAAGGASYAAELVRDAGGDYLWADDPSVGALPLSFEAVLDRGSEADIWLNPNFWFTLDDGLAEDERYALFRPFQTGDVYNNIARINDTFGNDIFESGAVHPERVLADLIAIFHPDLLPEHDLIYYGRLQ